MDSQDSMTGRAGGARINAQEALSQPHGHDELLHSSSVWADSTDKLNIASSNRPTTASSSTAHSLHSVHVTSDTDTGSDTSSNFEIIDVDIPCIVDTAEVPLEAQFNRIHAAVRSKLQPQATRSQAEAVQDNEDWDDIVEGASVSDMESGNGDEFDASQWRNAGPQGDATDLAGIGEHGSLVCTVTKPLKEGEGAQNAYISYLVTTDTDFKSFQAPHQTVRRRFTDFVFLYKTLLKEYPQCAVPPLPDKHNMSYVRGDRFSTDFTARRAHSLGRFLKRLTLHPVLRRAVLVTLFLESSDWNAVMRSRPNRAMSAGENSGVLETWTDSFLNVFQKVHKPDKRFTEVDDRAKKLDEDLVTVSKTVARVAKRDSDLETDYSDLATQFQKLAALEPGLTDEFIKFSGCLSQTSEGWKALKEHTDQDYLGSLKDMEAYSHSVKNLMRTREQKQLDFEGLTEYLNKAAYERDTLASHGSMGASGFLRQKIEDVRGVDHEQARRERQRKLEVQIQRLTTEVEGAKKTSEAFDEEVVKEVSDFERIKGVEFRDSLEGLADANIAFHEQNVEVWEQFIKDLEARQAERKAAAEGATGPGAAG